ncbi:hypothetical protein O3M35_007743 [Rhynocoris fuscipes]|uniref:Reverse transcriptase/retrotransposon-derived protein RNase H-like domain-containing protein n=1 Tax=Rhynocoris fuscipes TaxID=488301 RepID=A0AAW1DD37_9HEMI
MNAKSTQRLSHYAKRHTVKQINSVCNYFGDGNDVDQFQPAINIVAPTSVDDAWDLSSNDMFTTAKTYYQKNSIEFCNRVQLIHAFDRCFQGGIEDHITISTKDAFFVPSSPCDASSSGLGACLLQKGHSIEFASRTLNNAEQNYAQIERELLSVVFAELDESSRDAH